jgi:hypothetical protein
MIKKTYKKRETETTFFCLDVRQKLLMSLINVGILLQRENEKLFSL